MDDITISFAKDHLEDLIARARRGEVVTINDGQGTVQLTAAPRLGGVTSKRVIDALPPFVPLNGPRVAGQLAGLIPPPPNGFFDPMTEEELKEWYGDDV